MKKTKKILILSLIFASIFTGVKTQAQTKTDTNILKYTQTIKNINNEKFLEEDEKAEQISKIIDLIIELDYTEKISIEEKITKYISFLSKIYLDESLFSGEKNQVTETVIKIIENLYKNLENDKNDLKWIDSVIENY